jgi:hypothetical protein
MYRVSREQNDQQIVSGLFSLVSDLRSLVSGLGFLVSVLWHQFSGLRLFSGF